MLLRETSANAKRPRPATLHPAPGAAHAPLLRMRAQKIQTLMKMQIEVKSTLPTDSTSGTLVGWALLTMFVVCAFFFFLLATGLVLYLPSLSANTLIYKGMLSADQIETMFPDIVDPLVESALALVHQRFSTNTFPSWRLAHPYRFLAHNGEINTVRGNVNWMNARRRTMESELLGADLDKMWPIIPHGQSDSARTSPQNGPPSCAATPRSASSGSSPVRTPRAP